MSTLRLAQPEPRHVVPAAEAEARMREASDEIEELRTRLAQVAEEVEAAEQRALTSPREVELPESAQPTLQFVEDLVSTNRERMRDLLSHRYAWVGDRLADAHAEAQAIVGEALDELTAALSEHDAARASHLDDSPVAELIASISDSAPVAWGAASEPTVVARVSDVGVGAARDAADDDDEVSRVTYLSDRGSAVAPPPEAVESAASADSVVEAAVQAVLRALTAPATEAELVTAPAVSPQSAASATVLSEGMTDPGQETEASVTIDADGPVVIAAEGATSPARHMAAPGDKRPSPRYEDFWAREKLAAESQPKLAPRDVVVSMLVLVVMVVVLLALIG